jgi:hypothetical protein
MLLYTMSAWSVHWGHCEVKRWGKDLHLPHHPSSFSAFGAFIKTFQNMIFDMHGSCTRALYPGNM